MNATGADRRYYLANLLLAVHVVAGTIGALLVGLGIGAGWGLIGLSVTSLPAAYLLGQG